MTSKKESAALESLYAEAHTKQYTTKDLGAALKLYQVILEEHAGTQEADFCLVQIQHIVKAAVPKQELFDTQVALAQKHLSAA